MDNDIPNIADKLHKDLTVAELSDQAYKALCGWVQSLNTPQKVNALSGADKQILLKLANMKERLLKTECKILELQQQNGAVIEADVKPKIFT